MLFSLPIGYDYHYFSIWSGLDFHKTYIIENMIIYLIQFIEKIVAYREILVCICNSIFSGACLLYY